MLIITAPGQGAQTPGFLAPWLEVPGVAERLGAASELAGRDLIRYGTTGDARTRSGTRRSRSRCWWRPRWPRRARWRAATRRRARRRDRRAQRRGAGRRGPGRGAERGRRDAPGPGARRRPWRRPRRREPTGMTAVLGGDQDDVLAALARHGLTPANINGAGQIVAAGTLAELDAFAADPPAGARLRPLQVAGAFHTRHMAPAVAALRDAAAEVTVTDPVVTLLSNADGAAVTTGKEWLERIVAQVAAPVRWDLCHGDHGGPGRDRDHRAAAGGHADRPGPAGAARRRPAGRQDPGSSSTAARDLIEEHLSEPDGTRARPPAGMAADRGADLGYVPLGRPRRCRGDRRDGGPDRGAGYRRGARRRAARSRRRGRPRSSNGSSRTGTRSARASPLSVSSPREVWGGRSPRPKGRRMTSSTFVPARRGCADHLARRLPARQRGDQRRPRGPGRHQRRVDPQPGRHHQPPVRRAGRDRGRHGGRGRRQGAGRQRPVPRRHRPGHRGHLQHRGRRYRTRPRWSRHRLGIVAPGAYDLNAACAGFCYALANAVGRGPGWHGPARAGHRGGEDDGVDRPRRPLHLHHLRRRGGRRGGRPGRGRRAGRASARWCGAAPATWPTNIAIADRNSFLYQEGQAVFRWATTAMHPIAAQACERAGRRGERPGGVRAAPGEPADHRGHRAQARRAAGAGGRRHRARGQHVLGVDPAGAVADEPSAGTSSRARRRC